MGVRYTGNYGPKDSVPPEAIAGAWKVDAAGNVVPGSFQANPKYRPKQGDEKRLKLHIAPGFAGSLHGAEYEDLVATKDHTLPKQLFVAGR